MKKISCGGVPLIRFVALALLVVVAAGCQSTVPPPPEFRVVLDYSEEGVVSFEDAQELGKESTLEQLRARLSEAQEIWRTYSATLQVKNGISEEIEEYEEVLSELMAESSYPPKRCISAISCSRKDMVFTDLEDFKADVEALQPQLEKLQSRYDEALALYALFAVEAADRGWIEFDDPIAHFEATKVQSMIFASRSGHELILQFDSVSLPQHVSLVIENGISNRQVFIDDQLALRNGFSDAMVADQNDVKVSLVDMRNFGSDRVPLNSLFDEALYLDVAQSLITVPLSGRDSRNEDPERNQNSQTIYNESRCFVDDKDDQRQPIDTTVIGQVRILGSRRHGAQAVGTAFRLENDYILTAGHVVSDRLKRANDAMSKQDKQKAIDYIQVWFRPNIESLTSPANESAEEHKFFIDAQYLSCEECVIDFPGVKFPKGPRGNDWAIFKLKSNSITGKSVGETFPQERGLKLRRRMPTDLDDGSMYVLGFGESFKDEIDLKMQIASGEVLEEKHTHEGYIWIPHLIDTDFGSSGGPVIFSPDHPGGSLIEAESANALSGASIVGIHAGGPCDRSSSNVDDQTNEATSLSSPSFLRALTDAGLIPEEQQMADSLSLNMRNN